MFALDEEVPMDQDGTPHRKGRDTKTKMTLGGEEVAWLMEMMSGYCETCGEANLRCLEAEAAEFEQI